MLRRSLWFLFLWMLGGFLLGLGWAGRRRKGKKRR